MAVTCNITSTFGATTPTGGYTNESSKDEAVEKFMVLDEAGDRVRMRAGKLITKDVQISGAGSADYSVVSAGDFIVDVFKAISAETEETGDGEYVRFNVSGKIYSNVA